MIFIIFACLLPFTRAQPCLSANEYAGEALGALRGAAVQGAVHIVDKDRLQITGFTATNSGASLTFWFDAPNPAGKVSKFYIYNRNTCFLNPISQIPLGGSDDRIVIEVPSGSSVVEFRKFGIWSNGAYLASVDISPNVVLPSPQQTQISLKGSLYNVASGAITVLSKRTLLIPNFTFLGTKPPDGYIFVGNLSRDGEVLKQNGKKCFVRDWDDGTSNEPKALQKDWAGETIVADLPANFDVEHIDFVGVYCFAVGVDFGHSLFPKVKSNLPPYIPPVLEKVLTAWNETLISGVSQLDFYLGPPGKKRGYEAIRGAVPNKWVWYVNEQMAPLIEAKRGTQYTLRVFGGQFWQLYLSNDTSGGYNIKPENEKLLVKKYVEQTNASEAMCWFGRKDVQEDPDAFESFQQFRQHLYKRCDPENAAPFVMQWTPDSTTPDTVYYGSLEQYNMGWKIHIT